MSSTANERSFLKPFTTANAIKQKAATLLSMTSNEIARIPARKAAAMELANTMTREEQEVEAERMARQVKEADRAREYAKAALAAWAASQAREKMSSFIANRIDSAKNAPLRAAAAATARSLRRGITRKAQKSALSTIKEGGKKKKSNKRKTSRK